MAVAKVEKKLLIDLGNSSVSFALWDGESYSDYHCCSYDDFLGYLPRFKDRYMAAIIASVVPEREGVLRGLLLDPFFITHETIPVLTLNLEKPEQVGADRLVNALAAYQAYRCPTLVVDSGTALTFCYTTGEGCYEGGLIFPGMTIASQSLNDYTAKIPLIEVAPKTEIVGKTTQDAVEGGLYHGYIALINGVITQYRDQIPALKVIGTGGGLEVLSQRLDLDAFDPELVMKGLGGCAEFL